MLHSKLFLLVLVLLIPSCNDVVRNNNNTALSSEHRWTTSEVLVIKQFLISNLQTASDKSNQYAGDVKAAELGHKLFFNKKLSKTNSISCSSCHKPEFYFTDGLKTAKGITQGRRNTPTIVGASHEKWFFHDGRVDSLWAQALGPLENAKEHAAYRTDIVLHIFNDVKLHALYESVFGLMPDFSDSSRFIKNSSPVSDLAAMKNWRQMSVADQNAINKVFVNIGKSIAAYETILKPAGSKVDRYISAVLNKDAALISKTLSRDEATGLRLFAGKANCILCHSGPMLTDSEFHNIATVDINNKPYDMGRYEGAKQVLRNEFNCKSRFNDNKNDNCDELNYINLDAHETVASFKTPGLRNVTKTAPYMHDGQFKNLISVIDHYDNADKLILGKKDLLPISLSDRDKQALLAFLKALDSAIAVDSKWLAAP